MYLIIMRLFHWRQSYDEPREHIAVTLLDRLLYIPGSSVKTEAKVLRQKEDLGHMALGLLTYVAAESSKPSIS